LLTISDPLSTHFLESIDCLQPLTLHHFSAPLILNGTNIALCWAVIGF
jgi:hypothetical protein